MKDLRDNEKHDPLKVVELGAEHLNDCLEIDALVFKGLWTRAQWEKELSDSTRLCIGISNNSKLLAVSSGWIILDELHITSLGVDPLHREMGIGKLLLSTLLLKAHKFGVKHATLEVKKKNSKAISLYKNLGFQVAGYRPNYYKDGSEAIILWHSLKDENE